MMNLAVSETEQATFNAWYEEHRKRCSVGFDDISVRLTGTGIGTRVRVTCNHCHVDQDITDYASW